MPGGRRLIDYDRLITFSPRYRVRCPKCGFSTLIVNRAKYHGFCIEYPELDKPHIHSECSMCEYNGQAFIFLPLDKKEVTDDHRDGGAVSV